MSQKQEKKNRRFLKKQFRSTYQGIAETLAKEDHEFLKPRPRWIPEWIWIKLLKIFVRIK